MKITSFKHKGLEAFYTTGNHKGIIVDHVPRLVMIFNYLTSATSIEDIAAVHSFKLHQLKGNKAGTWSITVRANWRLTFKMNGDECHLLDYEDYH
jgi:proteic killer suppression protein